MNSKTPRDQRGWYPVPDGTRIAHGAQTLAHELEFIYCVQLSAFAGRKTEQRAPRKGDCRRPMSLLFDSDKLKQVPIAGPCFCVF